MTLRAFIHKEVATPFERWPFWLMFAWRDVKNPYGRTVFGPLAITFQTAVWVAFIYFIFKDSLGKAGNHYMIYLAHGYPTFIFLQSCIIGGQSLLKRNAGMIQNMDAPFLIFTLRFVTASFFTLLFSHLVLIGTLYLDNGPIGINLFVSAFWYLALIPLAISIALTASFFGLFFPNLMVVVGAITRFLFFATPILWYIEVRSGFRYWVATLNPVAHLISLSREPLMGKPVPILSVWVYFGLLVMTWMLGLFMLRYMKQKVVFRI